MSAVHDFVQRFQPLAYTTRGEFHGQACLETVHWGAISVVDGQGKELFSVGDSSLPVHTRSLTKPFQLMPLLLSGGQKRYHLSPEEIVVLMSSHDGSPMHTQRVAALLHAQGLSADELQCGSHWPVNKQEGKRLMKSGESPSVLHNNCSGKHTGMLLSCLINGWSRHDYLSVQHPLQQMILNLITELAEVRRENIGLGQDGCSAPTFVMPLKSIARLFSHLAYPNELAAEKSAVLKTLYDSGTRYPVWLRGEGALDTVLMQALPGALFAKTGADGGFAVAVAPSKRFPFGLGIALKVADGDGYNLVRTISIIGLLKDLQILDNDTSSWLNSLRKLAVFDRLNCAGLTVGTIKKAFVGHQK